MQKLPLRMITVRIVGELRAARAEAASELARIDAALAAFGTPEPRAKNGKRVLSAKGRKAIGDAARRRWAKARAAKRAKS